VILDNLLLLLLGFALLADLFEKSKVPAVLPAYLPDDWKGAFLLLALVFVISSFLDNIAAAMIGGAMAHTVFPRQGAHRLSRGDRRRLQRRRRRQRRRRHDHDHDVDRRRRSAARAGGLHRLGRRPVRVRHPGGADPAALLADHQGPRPGTAVDGRASAIVAFVLVAAIVVNVTMNTRFAA
jgi:hypothetical protein